MNANHARPLAAFWLLAVAAAVVTGIGLRGGGDAVQVAPGATPSSATRSLDPGSDPGGAHSSGPTVSATQGGAWSSAIALEHALGFEVRGIPAASARTTVAAPQVAVPTDPSAAADAGGTAGTSTGGTGSSGAGKDSHSGSATGSSAGGTPAATPAAKPTPPTHGKGSGRGHGKPSTPPSKAPGKAVGR